MERQEETGQNGLHPAPAGYGPAGESPRVRVLQRPEHNGNAESRVNSPVSAGPPEIPGRGFL